MLAYMPVIGFNEIGFLKLLTRTFKGTLAAKLPPLFLGESVTEIVVELSLKHVRKEERTLSASTESHYNNDYISI